MRVIILPLILLSSLFLQGCIGRLLGLVTNPMGAASGIVAGATGSATGINPALAAEESSRAIQSIQVALDESPEAVNREGLERLQKHFQQNLQDVGGVSYENHANRREHDRHARYKNGESDATWSAFTGGPVAVILEPQAAPYMEKELRNREIGKFRVNSNGSSQEQTENSQRYLQNLMKPAW